MFRWLLILLVLLAAVAGLALGVVNPEPVTLDLIAIQLSLPLGALVLAVLSLGILAGLILTWLLFILPARLRARSRSSSRNPRGVATTDQRDA